MLRPSDTKSEWLKRVDYYYLEWEYTVVGNVDSMADGGYLFSGG